MFSNIKPFSDLVKRRAALKLRREKVCTHVLVFLSTMKFNAACFAYACYTKAFDWYCFVDLTFLMFFILIAELNNAVSTMPYLKIPAFNAVS